MNLRKARVFLFFVLVIPIVGCTDLDKASENKVDQSRIYFDYIITAEENNETVVCVFQFRDGDAEGKTLDVEPAKVQLDGQIIERDSAKLSGFFYEVQKPMASFAGKHTIDFITAGNKKYRNEFEFSPFFLEKELPEKIHRRPFTIQLISPQARPATANQVRLLLLDTAFESSGFNNLVPVVNGKIRMDSSVLSTIKNGPVNLELYMEQEIPLKQRTMAGGRISITYGLRREFELVGE